MNELLSQLVSDQAPLRSQLRRGPDPNQRGEVHQFPGVLSAHLANAHRSIPLVGLSSKSTEPSCEVNNGELFQSILAINL
ncbi:hypothetical protein F8388_008223 [Cannabis sativa]|uniref:Uncharacterized protein n=1 Tax=Cannabis sativa TaxID=3483 RepID=A0A7J6EXD3_CANSA|nr:hypothetical protein F8388_008223 [Cannabis sativa]KAF4391316.1 hypothetical protein G4B88_016626 [Cannabis sativa]